jgi:hypothetical protein
MNISEEQLRIIVNGFEAFDATVDRVRAAFNAISRENQIETLMPYQTSVALDEMLTGALGSREAVDTFYWYVYDTEYGAHDARVIINSVEYTIDNTYKLFDLLSNQPIRE